MHIEPEVSLVEYSYSDINKKFLYTFHARYWRPIHSEVMTHRKFGRNARSSRAVPNKVLLREPIVEPLYYGANQPGMQSWGELTGWRRLLARMTWLALAHITRAGVRVLNFAGLHKQWSNRPLEWFGCIDVLITASDLENWYALRDHSAAAPEIRLLAQKMKQVVATSTPRLLMEGEWHLPFISPVERETLSLDEQITRSITRCARISYKPFDGSDTYGAELQRYNKLFGQVPIHASPAEHQATPDLLLDGRWANLKLHGNLTGWIQKRKLIPNENIPG